MKYLPFARQVAVAAYALSAIMLAGCATVTPLDDKGLRDLRYQTLVVTSAKAPEFKVALPGSALVSGGQEHARRLMASHPISDPAEPIRGQLLKHLQDLHSVRSVNSDLGARYGLRVDTMKWGLEYDGIRFDQYRVSLHSRVQVQDMQSNAVLAEAKCQYVGSDGESTPRLADYHDKGNSTLQLEMERAIHYCTNYFIAGLFPSNGDHGYRQLLPTRAQFLAKGPTLFQLPANVSSIKPVALYWKPDQGYLAEEVANRSERQVLEAKRQVAAKKRADADRVAQRESQPSEGSLRNMTACKTNPELFAFCHY